MNRPVAIKAQRKYKIWIKYSDGIQGEIDLFEYAGQGIFSWWEENDNFMKVSLGPHGEVRWEDQIDLCPDALYMKLTGKTPEEIFPNLKKEEMNA